MITRPINQVFSHREADGKTKVILQVVPNNSCNGCYFDTGVCCNTRDTGGLCSMSNRTDHNDVIFKLKELIKLDSILEIV